jgi:uncharacterized protein (TIGR00369 family)
MRLPAGREDLLEIRAPPCRSRGEECYNPATMSTTERYALGALFGPGREDMTSHTPHARYLGMKVVETGPGLAVIMLPYRSELVGDPVRKVVFGGVITTLLDHASGLAVACALDVFRSIATVDLRVDYVRAAEPGLDLYARVECYKVTRNVAFIRGIAYERVPSDPFASCLGTFMLGASPAASGFAQLVREGAPEGEEGS